MIYSLDGHVLYADKYIQMVNILHDLYYVVFKSVFSILSNFVLAIFERKIKKRFGINYMSCGT